MTHGTPLPVVLVEPTADDVAALGPIVHTRPPFELRCGLLNLRERIAITGCAQSIHAVVREPLRALLSTVGVGVGPPSTGEVLAVDARLHGSVEALRDALSVLGPNEEATVAGIVVAARLDVDDLDSLEFGARAEGRPMTGLEILSRPWQVVSANDEALVADAATLARAGAPQRRLFGVEFEPETARAGCLRAEDWIPSDRLAERFPGVTWIDPSKALVAASARIRPGAVIDAEAGPVVLGPEAVVHPLSVVTGPAYVGPGTTVNPGAKLREGTSLGALCKVGGEIEESVVLDLSNKQHDGFLGHALVGSWVNLGADTNGSDLKNNYGSVRVDLGDGVVDTGETFVGQHLADHVKTGIDTMLTTGGVVGVAGNVFGGGFAPRFVPAFGWGGADGIATYRLDDALATARTAMGRRGVRWTPAVEALLRQVFEATRGQRDG